MEPVTLEGIKLFSYFRSSASQRVRIALNFKKIKYDIIPVHLLKKHQSEGFYKEINPTGLLPSLYIDGHLLTESLPILEYLEETRTGEGQVSLLPKDPLAKAKVRMLMEHVNSGIQPLQNLRTLVKVHNEFEANKLEWCTYWNKVGLDSLEKKLDGLAGKYAYGDEPTLADCVIYPQLVGAFNR